MKLKKNSWMNRLIIGMFNPTFELPKTLCTYFWTLVIGLILAILYLPITIWYFINYRGYMSSRMKNIGDYYKFTMSYETYGGVAGVGTILYLIVILLTVLGGMALESIDILPELTILYILKSFGAGLALSIIGACMWGVLYLIFKVIQYFGNKTGKSIHNSIGFKYIKARKSKICPIIEYED